MLINGKYIPCNKETITCECNYVYCKHSDDILATYLHPAYGSEHKLYKIIKILLDYQESSIEEICNSELPLLPVLELYGFKPCSYDSTPAGCIDICGQQYQTYTFSKKCGEIELSDSQILQILSIKEYLHYPNRDNIYNICTIFGWELIYTEDYINIHIGNDDPNLVKFIIDNIPIPIGEQLRIITDC